MDGFGAVTHARRSEHLPVVLTRGEVDLVLAQLDEPCRLMASLMYGSGLRLMECCTLRIKDIDFERGEITVREGKGRKDRVTMLPQRLVERAVSTILRQPGAKVYCSDSTVRMRAVD